MKVQFLNATHRKGLSKASNKPYDMCKLNYLKPIEVVRNEKMEYYGFGMTAQEIDLDPRCIHMFETAMSGDEVDLVLEPNPRFPQYNWVVGIK